MYIYILCIYILCMYIYIYIYSLGTYDFVYSGTQDLNQRESLQNYMPIYESADLGLVIFA